MSLVFFLTFKMPTRILVFSERDITRAGPDSQVPVGDYELPIGQAEVVQEGTDATWLQGFHCAGCHLTLRGAMPSESCRRTPYNLLQWKADWSPGAISMDVLLTSTAHDIDVLFANVSFHNLAQTQSWRLQVTLLGWGSQVGRLQARWTRAALDSPCISMLLTVKLLCCVITYNCLMELWNDPEPETVW